MSERRTIYESARRRRKRRVRAITLVVLIVLLLAAVAVAAVFFLRGPETAASGDAAASPSPSVPASPSAAPARLARLTDVEVHRGETATIRYRVVTAPEATAVTLVVTDAGGQRVKARRLADAAPAGKWCEAAVPIDLPPGRYTYELRLGDGGASSQAGATPGSSGASPAPGASASAALVVLAPLPPAFPGKKAVAAAREWMAGRDGDVAFAVVDSNGEPAGGYREHEPFQLASLSKAVMLVASLRDDPTPDATTEATLTKMITESDNGAAYAIYGQVGARGMREVARAAGMQDYEQGSGLDRHALVRLGPGALLLAARVTGARRGA